MDITVTSSHLETLPTAPEDDAKDGRIWSVYLVERTFLVAGRAAADKIQEDRSLYSQHLDFAGAEESRKAAAYL